MAHPRHPLRGVLLGLALILGVELAADDPAKSYKGEYVWGEESGPVEAVFEPTKANEWNVVFHFEMQGKAHTWKGTALGKLDEGSLSGQVQHDGFTFAFSGYFKNGEFDGTYNDITTSWDFTPDGTLKLRR